MDTITQRTPEEIKEALHRACLGDFTEENSRVAELQTLLIQALIWKECPPYGGWRDTFHRQTAALRELSEEARTCRDISAFDWLAPTTEETPMQLIADINKRFYGQTPWNHLFVDDYIERAL